jgi:hypothetical protein
MMKANRIYAGVDWSAKYKEAVDVNILDPFAVLVNPTKPHWVNPRYVDTYIDPVKNLRHGAKRLSELVKEHGNLKDALIAFYTPCEESGKWSYGAHFSEEDLEFLRKDIRKLAYTAMNGVAFATDGGMWSISLQYTVPDDF